MSDVSRRGFLKAGAAAAAGAAALPVLVKEADAHSTLVTTIPYPRTKVGNLRALPTSRAVPFTYPDASAPAVLLKLGSEAVGGIGPDRDVVAYSVLCTHKGCPVVFNAADRMLVCPCHFSTFDPAKDGQMIIGHATQSLPRIELALDGATGDVFATEIHGLVYGRAANVVKG